MRNGKATTLTFVLLLLLPFWALAAPTKPKPKPKPPSPPVSASASAEPPSPADPLKEEAKIGAREHFDRGMLLFKLKVWNRALVEFLASRSLYATRSNTQNAAICLRNLNRYDEALDMLETLVKQYPNLAEAEKELVEAEIAENRNFVGTIEIRVHDDGARVTIDGRERGTTPMAAPVRVTVGSHAVQIFKAGFSPIQRRVDVASGKAAGVDGELQALAQSGGLTVTEQSGKQVDVLIGGILVGKTPWQGPFAVGDHIVLLRGEGNLGSQPASTVVTLNQTTTLALLLEALESSLRVEPTPISATVSIDGAAVGAGVWEGRLRAGDHTVEVAAPGFRAQKRSVKLLVSEKPERVAIELERDMTPRPWGASVASRLFIEADGSLPLGFAPGGDVRDSCSGACERPLPIGFAGALRVGYQLRVGLGLSLEVGYLTMKQKLVGRPASMKPFGKPSVPSTLDEDVTLRGLLIGVGVGYELGGKWPLLFRLGGGALIGSAADKRSGSYVDATGATRPIPATLASPDAATDPYSTTSDATYAFAAPEIQFGPRLGDHFQISIGVRAMVLVALTQPRFKNADPLDFVAGTAGVARFEEQSLLGSTVILVLPGVGLRYDFGER